MYVHGGIAWACVYWEDYWWKCAFVGVVVMGKLGCDLLVLLEACVILRFSVFCCVSGVELSPVASLSGVGSIGRVRLVLYVLCGW